MLLVYPNDGKPVQSNLCEASGAQAPDGETLDFVKNTALNSPVESWMMNVLNEMKDGVQKALSESLLEFKKKKKPNWVREHHGQVRYPVLKMSYY